jgi:hypothetical protein
VGEVVNQLMLITINPTFEWSDEAQKYVLVSHDGQYEGEPTILFDRSQQAAGKAAQTNENSTASLYGGQAQGINSQLIPGLEKEATNPTGINPTDINNMTVASQQGAGGANSGIVGQTGLQATRTRNTGNIGSVLDEAAREKGRTLSSNAKVKLGQQQFAQEALGTAAGKDTQAQLAAMGMVPETINSTVQAGKSGWLQNVTGFMDSLGGLAGGAGKLIHG